MFFGHRPPGEGRREHWAGKPGLSGPLSPCPAPGWGLPESAHMSLRAPGGGCGSLPLPVQHPGPYGLCPEPSPHGVQSLCLLSFAQKPRAQSAVLGWTHPAHPCDLALPPTASWSLSVWPAAPATTPTSNSSPPALAPHTVALCHLGGAPPCGLLPLDLPLPVIPGSHRKNTPRLCS